MAFSIRLATLDETVPQPWVDAVRAGLRFSRHPASPHVEWWSQDYFTVVSDLYVRLVSQSSSLARLERSPMTLFVRNQDTKIIQMGIYRFPIIEPTEALSEVEELAKRQGWPIVGHPDETYLGRMMGCDNEDLVEMFNWELAIGLRRLLGAENSELVLSI